MEMSKLENQTNLAVKKYLSLREPQAEEQGEVNDFLVYLTDRGYVFFNVTYSKDDWKSTPVRTLRSKFEKAIIEFFAENPDARNDIPLRCDEIQFRILNKDRAIIRHVMNAVVED